MNKNVKRENISRAFHKYLSFLFLSQRMIQVEKQELQ